VPGTTAFRHSSSDSAVAFVERFDIERRVFSGSRGFLFSSLSIFGNHVCLLRSAVTNAVTTVSESPTWARLRTAWAFPSNFSQ
jgi:hypothetical protein